MRESTPKNRKDIQPATALWKLYRPQEAPRAFNATDVVQARQWQKRTRHALAQRIGLNQIRSASPRARILEKVDKREYVREKIVLRTGPDTLMPVYFLLPKNAVEPLPVVLAFHGHGYGVKDIVGLWEDGQERDTPDGYHKDFAVALIAPRPLLVEAGTRAPIFPLCSVRSSVAKARSVYQVFDARDRVVTDYFEGRHQISGRKAYEFLKQQLTPENQDRTKACSRRPKRRG